MNLLLLLLIIIIIIIGIYLHNNYYNYSVQDVGSVEITQSVSKNITENISEEIYNEIKNNCSRSDKLVNVYLNKNNIYDSDNINELINDVDMELNTELKTELKTELDTNLNSSSNYVDILMENSNLNIKIPEQDNSECIDSNNLTTHAKSKTKKIIDWYLRANSEYDKTKYNNFELIGDDIIDTDEDTNEDTNDTNDTNDNENDVPNLVNQITDINNYK